MATTKECIKCKKEYAIEMFPKTNSPFFNTRADVCVYCIENMIDGEDYGSVDKVCQWLNYPLLMGEWMKLYKLHRNKAFRYYSELFFNDSYNGEVDWMMANGKLKEIIAAGDLEEISPEFNWEWANRMKDKWQLECTPTEYKHLEFLYNDIKRTQNVVSGSQEDSVRKMCKLSLMADRELSHGLPGDKFIKAYNELAKASDFSPKTAKNVGDFESCGELFKWLEKNGWRRKFYDFNVRDDVDLTIQNVQEYLRRLVAGEPNLSEEVEKAREAMKNFNLGEIDLESFSTERLEAEEHAAKDTDVDEVEEFQL